MIYLQRFACLFRVLLGLDLKQVNASHDRLITALDDLSTELQRFR